MGLLHSHSHRNEMRAGRWRTAFQLEEEEVSVLSLESELFQQSITPLNAAAAAEAQKEAVAAQRLDGLDESWEAMNTMDDDQTVCWLEQKLDEVESYLMPAASPELEPLLLLEGVTSSPPARPVEGVIVSPSVEEVTLGSAEEAFLESALIDVEADPNEEEVIIVDEEEEALILDEQGESKEEISLEATVLHELESVVSTLGTGTRLCVRNALYRLAGSAAMRQELHEKTGNSTPSRLGDTESIEASTNLFDRTIANLLFHRHTPSTQASQTEQSASSTSSNVSNATMFPPVMVDRPVKMPFPPIHKHRCAASREAKKPATMVMNRQPSQAVVTKKLPAVMTNKQLDFPSLPMSSYTMQPMMTAKASGVHCHESVARKLPSFAEKRRRPISTTTSRKHVKLL